MFEDISINLAASVIYDFGKAIVHAANKTEAVQLARKQLGMSKALHDFPDRYVEALVELRFEQKPPVVLDFFRAEEIMAAFYAYYYGPVESRGDDKKHQIALNRCTTFLKQKYPHTPTGIDISAEIDHFWQVFRQKVQESRTVKEVEIHLKLEELTAAYTDMATAWQELQAWLVQKNAEQIEVGGQVFSVGSEQAQEVLRAEVERAISIVNSKNVLVDSKATAGRDLHIGDKQEVHHHYVDKKIPRNLTNPPFDPPVFLGREEELVAVHNRLFGGDDFLMLVNGQGGMGKTSFAAKYWKNYQHEYQHRAFFFVATGIENALLGIAPVLGVGFPDVMPGRERLVILLQHISELDRPCLIVLDNANDADDLDAHYSLLRSCSNCHLLITSRLSALRESPTHPIGALSDALALELFQRHYLQHSAADDALFFGIFRAVGGNTLVVEILAKNLRTINANEAFYPLEALLADLQAKGLLRLTEQARIQVDWQNLAKSTPEQIISAMYDLRPLAPKALALLSAFAVLPAEDIAYTLLKTLLAPTDARAFSQLLTDLHQTGWIEKTDIDGHPHYKCNPVVQEMVRVKNEGLLADCEWLIAKLNEKLVYEPSSGHLIHATYEEAAVFAHYAEAVVLGIAISNRNLGVLCERIGRYHTATGNLARAYFLQEKKLAISQALLAAEPDNAYSKNELAISYTNLGDTHMALGDLPQALTFFEERFRLGKELHEAYPQNVSFKNGLAVSYAKLGGTYTALGDLPRALTFFEKDIELSKELYEAYPQNVGYKNGLAISYEKLGETHTALGDLPRALTFFEERSRLGKELHEAFPQNVVFKNGLAVSYSKLSETHYALGNLPMALIFLEQWFRLGKELHETFPQNVEFKFNYANCLSYLGQLHIRISGGQKAKDYIEKAYQLYSELYSKTQIPKYYQRKRELEMLLSINSGCLSILTLIVKMLMKVPLIRKTLKKWTDEARKEIAEEFKENH